MSAVVQFQISDAAKAILARMEDRKGVLRAVAREVDTQTQLTVGHITAKRLTGTGPFPVSEHRLGVRTGHLRRSLRGTSAVVEGDTVTSTIGSNVKYAGIHEFGGTIKRVLLAGSVRLATDRQGNLLRRGRNGKLAVFARKSRKSAQTVSFSGGKRYEITIPARAPITTGIQDRVPQIGAAVSRAIIAFHTGGGK